MKDTVIINQPHIDRQLPMHELTARRRRIQGSLPKPTESTRPTAPPTPAAPLGRSTPDNHPDELL